jgi:N-acyl-D-aspartate/D-glutamate deacylase
MNQPGYRHDKPTVVIPVMGRTAAKLQNGFAGNHCLTVHLLAVDKICLCTVDLQIRLWQLRTVGGTVEERRRVSMLISHDGSRNMHMFDLIIRGATVIDGLGNEPIETDVTVNEGRIVHIGCATGNATETIDAAGLCLAPGLVDIHTHYDAQITWDSTLSPSSSLGVTTVVMGNCGFGIVPAQPLHTDALMKNLSVVEAMDLNALRAGVQWKFSDFTGYMEFVRQRKPYLNVAALIGHSATRLDVMGEEASSRRLPTDTEMHRMREIVRTALRAGAIGFSSSFSPNHSGYGGIPMPSTIADEAELQSLVAVLGEEKSGVFQIAAGARATVDFLETLSAQSGRTVSMSGGMTLYAEGQPRRAVETLDQCLAATGRGHRVTGQVSCQPLSMDFSATDPYPFYSYKAITAARNVSKQEQRSLYSDRSFRQQFREQLKTPDASAAFSGNWERILISEIGDQSLAGIESQSIAELARQRHCDPVDAFFDIALADDLRTVFVGLLFNADDVGVLPILKHDGSVIALSDAGAHLSVLCDAGYGLHFLGHWVRDRGDFDLADGVRRLTSYPADLYGMSDRGRLVTGAAADLLLFDPKSVGISGLIRRQDLPAGAARLVREPRGVHGTWVNGVKVFSDGRTLDLAEGPGTVLDRFNTV